MSPWCGMAQASISCVVEQAPSCKERERIWQEIKAVGVRKRSLTRLRSAVHALKDG